jgi:hypothetical protein
MLTHGTRGREDAPLPPAHKPRAVANRR